MARYRSCSIRGCEDKRSSRHSFPNPKKFPQLFEQWLLACDNHNLNDLSPQAIYLTKKICHLHFNKSDILSSDMLLKKNAVPTLNLPKTETDVIQSIEGKETIPCPSCSTELPSTETEIDESAIEKSLAAPSTSQPMEDVVLSTEGSDIHQSTPQKRDLWDIPSTSGISKESRKPMFHP